MTAFCFTRALLLFLISAISLAAVAEPQGTPSAHEAHFDAFVGLGVPAFTTYGATYYHGPKKDVAIRFQSGNGHVSGNIGYDTWFEEIIFLANFSNDSDKWEKFVGVGIGSQDITINTNYTDNGGTQFIENEKFEKKYLTLMMSAQMILPSGFSYGSDFALTYPIMMDSRYFANDNVYGTNNQTYNSVHRNFYVFKSLLATGASIQVNLFRFGWYF